MRCEIRAGNAFPAAGTVRRAVGALAVLTAVVLSAEAVVAADGVPKNPAARAKWAAVELDQVDEDFAFQGEYLGHILSGDCCWEPVGLQVVALGGGEFSARRYAGGLPGDGWWRGDPQETLTGRRDGDTLRLEGDSLRFAVSGGEVKVYRAVNETLQPAGLLRKVERISPTLGLRPPRCADVLFDGTDTGRLKNLKITPDGLMEVGADTVDAYGDFRLHLEFRLPYMPYARGQGRANSGAYLQSRYEVQILDSFGLEGVANECGGLYRQRQPDVNMCFPPLSWQTYDIDFRAARFGEDGKKTQNARITVWHNGVVIHNDVELTSKTGAGRPESAEPFPIRFQNHGNPVRFRNIWLVNYSAAPNMPAGDVIVERRGLPDPLGLFRVIGRLLGQRR